MKDRKTNLASSRTNGSIDGVGGAGPLRMAGKLVLDRKKRILVTLLVDETERQALRGLAEYDHTSQSAWMRKIIREEARALAADLRRRGKRVEKALDL